MRRGVWLRRGLWGTYFGAPVVMLGAPEDDSILVTIRAAAADSYDVVLGDDRCSGASSCRLGRVTGRLITSGAPRPEGHRVTLPGVGRAVFEESVCGANCSDTVLTWDHDRARYTIGMKAGELDDFRPIAPSASRFP